MLALYISGVIRVPMTLESLGGKQRAGTNLRKVRGRLLACTEV